MNTRRCSNAINVKRTWNSDYEEVMLLYVCVCVHGAGTRQILILFLISYLFSFPFRFTLSSVIAWLVLRVCECVCVNRMHNNSFYYYQCEFDRQHAPFLKKMRVFCIQPKNYYLWICSILTRQLFMIYLHFFKNFCCVVKTWLEKWLYDSMRFAPIVYVIFQK